MTVATTTAQPATSKDALKLSVPARNNDTQAILWRLVGYMADGENRRPFLIALAVRAISVLALIAIPFLTGQAINVISTPGGSPTMLTVWVVIAIVCVVIYFTTGAYGERSFARLATDGLYRLQCELFAHIQTLSLNFFDRQPLGELMSRVTNDTETVARFFESVVSSMIRSIFQIVVIVIVMFLINWQLAIAALVVVPVMLYVTSIIERLSTPAFAKLQEEIGQLSGFQEETIGGHKVIINARRQDWASARSEKYAGEVFNVGTQAYFTTLMQFPITQTLTMLQIVIVLMVGSWLVLAGETELGVVIAFTGYAGLLSQPLSEIANMTGTMLSAVAGARRVFEIMAEQPTVLDAPDAQPYAFKGGEVVFDNVDFSYIRGRKILRHNTFTARPGEMIGICGPTGAGKSTIINILTRYYDVDSGVILIDGQKLTTLTQESLRRQVGAVLQEAFLFSDTVMNNLKYAREGATDEECIAAATQANAHDFIMKLPQGYATLMTERGANLSQGQRQMLTIARAMVADPKILILDEATSNVDTRTEKLIQEGLRRLMEGRTSFVIAHRLSTIRNAAKIMVVNGGEIVEMDSHDNLMAQKGFYYSLYMSQFKGKGPAGASGSQASADFVST